jgi:hypothetical protein
MGPKMFLGWSQIKMVHRLSSELMALVNEMQVDRSKLMVAVMMDYDEHKQEEKKESPHGERQEW